ERIVRAPFPASGPRLTALALQLFRLPASPVFSAAISVARVLQRLRNGVDDVSFNFGGVRTASCGLYERIHWADEFHDVQICSSTYKASRQQHLPGLDGTGRADTLMSLKRHKQQQLHSDQSEVCELDDEDNYDDLTTVDDYVDDKRGVEGLQEGGSDSLSTALSRCAVCQDAASGVHYGVPACEGCKGFFRRIVSSRNIGGACAHSVPLEMTPQTRNTCQWCRLKKCCAVNMGRQRSKLGRRAKLRLRGASSAGAAAVVAPSDDQIMLPGCQSAATQLLVLWRHSDSWRQPERRRFAGFSSGRCNAGHSQSAKKVWLEKSCLMATPLAMICRRLAGPQRAAELEDLHNTLSFNNSVSHLILTAIDKFVGYWEADLNSQFAGNPACGDVIAENTRLILEGHRQTFYFSQNRMRQFMNDRLAQLQEPSPADEGEVLHTLVDYIPQLMLRIVAFSRNIFGGTSSQSMPEPAPQQQQHFETHRDRVSVSSCSDALTDSDKKRLIVQHSFKLVGMRFCASLVQSQQDFIIDPTMRFRLTRRFLQSAGHPMLSQLFLKFFDVSRKWDSLRIEENEMAFLSAFCLTSP
uniref:Nuclear receptor domain-containing protein n=1 Tax=Macrostomum lignano TaxID=282301 RepID=A0A1I8IU37_9PLAT